VTGFCFSVATWCGTLAERSYRRGCEILLRYSYLIVYRSESSPLQVVSILHGKRDVAAILQKRT
jgi:plasmid stabilization system protein ParE